MNLTVRVLLSDGSITLTQIPMPLNTKWCLLFCKMKKQFSLTIVCKHNNPNQIITTMDGEYVCKCGVVLDEKLEDNYTLPSKSTISLYHQMENGGDPQDMKVVNKKIHIYSSNVSEFSNICSKLELATFTQKRAWRIYHLLRNNTDFTKAKCASFAIYVACREGNKAIAESQIKEAIQSVLCVKNTPGMLAVISEMHDAASSLGINTNEGHSPNYYLNLAISQQQDQFNDQNDYDRFKTRAMENFTHMSGNHQNKARRAVSITLCELGFK